MTSLRKQNELSLTNNVGTPAYMAPELLKDSEKSHGLSPALLDVYSFGLTMFAVLSQHHPYSGDAAFVDVSMWTLRDKIAAGERPTIGGNLEKAPHAAISLMKACWDGDPSKRP